jgi:hypothetical protein
MKPLRVLLIGVGIIVLLVGVLVALALNSSVQTWAARRALGGQMGVRGEIGRVDIGLERVRAENVVLRFSGMVITLPALEADMAVLGAARERISVSRLVAKGWTLDLTAPGQLASATAATPRLPRAEASILPLPLAALGQAQTPGKTASAAVFPVGDLLTALQLPVDLLALDGVELAGTVIFPTTPGATPGRAQVTITGGGLAPGNEGTFQISADARLDDPAAPVSQLGLRSKLEARMNTPRTFNRVATTSTIEVRGSQLPNGAQLVMDIAAGGAGDNAVYSVSLRTPQKTLLELDAKPASVGSTELVGNWRLAMTHTDVAPFALGYPLPDFNAAGDGKVQVSSRDNSMGLSGSLRVQTSRLETVMPELQAVGALNTTARFDARRIGDDVRVTQLNVAINGARPVSEINTLQGLEYNLRTGELRVADPETDLLEVKLHGVPLDWARPFLGELQVTGSPVQGGWLAAARDGGFVLRAVSPLKIGGVAVSSQGRPLVQGVDVALSLSAEYAPSGWQARVEQGHVQAGTTRLLTFDARAGQASAPGAALVATSRFNADLNACLAQPGGEPYRMLRSGRASGDFIVAWTDRTELAAEFDFAGMVATSDEVLPRISLKIRADRAADGRIESHVPVMVTQNGRASDLTLNAQIRPIGETINIDAIVSGQHVFLQDVQVLAVPFAGGRPSEPVQPAPPIDRPVWAGIGGKLSIAFGTVVYSDTVRITNVEGEVTLGPDALSVPTLKAALASGGSFTFNGGLRYEPGTSQPYSLQGDIAAKEVEVGELLRAFSPGSTPPVEGKFDLSSKLSGQAADIALLAENASADARLSSRGGTLRALPVKTAESVRAGGGALADIAGVIGSLTGNSRAQRASDMLKAATDFSQVVGALAFDQLNIDVSRVAGGDIAIKDVSLISPMIRLLGTGGITNRQNTPFWQEPLNIRMQLSARGQMAANLKTLRLLKTDTDTLGYIPMVEDFSLEGTLMSITSPHLQALISRALSSL